MNVDQPVRFEDWSFVGFIVVGIIAVLVAVVVVVARSASRRRGGARDGSGAADVNAVPAVLLSRTASPAATELAFEKADGTVLTFTVQERVADALRDVPDGAQGMLHHRQGRFLGFDQWRTSGGR